MKINKALYLATILSLATGVANAEPLAKTDIDKFSQLWASSYAENDNRNLMTLYSDDAVLSPPTSEIISGKSNINTYLETLKNIGVKEYSISNIDMNVQGDIAYSTELWEATGVDMSGNSIILEGSISNVLERQENGSWKIKYQNWN